jgi:hypothetical protein
MSLRDLILSSAAPAPVAVETPRGTVFVRQMTVLEREQYESILRDADSQTSIRAALVQKTACDPDGSLLFGPGDYAALCALPFEVVSPIFDAAVRANGMAADAVEDAEKN